MEGVEAGYARRGLSLTTKEDWHRMGEGKGEDSGPLKMVHLGQVC